MTKRSCCIGLLYCLAPFGLSLATIWQRHTSLQYRREQLVWMLCKNSLSPSWRHFFHLRNLEPSDCANILAQNDVLSNNEKPFFFCCISKICSRVFVFFFFLYSKSVILIAEERFSASIARLRKQRLITLESLLLLLTDANAQNGRSIHFDYRETRVFA